MMKTISIPIELPETGDASEDLTPSSLALTRLMRDARNDHQRTVSVPATVPTPARRPQVENSDD